jgi:hypothetical protein
MGIDVMHKQQFVKLERLSDISLDRAWQKNVADSGVDNGYTIASGDDDTVIKEFEDSELSTTNNIHVYDFMGDPYSGIERFYDKHIEVFLHKDIGTYWVEYTDNIFDI